MLAVSQLRNPKNEIEGETEGFAMEEIDEFPDFAGGNLLDSIDFDDLFLGISDGDVLPDLEMDPELFAEFSSSELRNQLPANSASASSGEETVSTNNEPVRIIPEPSPKSRKSMAHSRKPSSKRKVKVDWTPELHRRFVQAVEQLGVDKAVPSRILELMGIDCLTRHNIASHLQKYRSHRKHLLAREAEAASWSQRRQMYGGGAGKRDPWIAPTMGFPPVTPPPVPVPVPHHFRPLHVWGHPSADQSMMPMWPKHPPPPPPHAWPPPLPRADPSFWIPHHHHHAPTPGTPCFLPPTVIKFKTRQTNYTKRFGGLDGAMAMYKVEQAGVGVPTGQTLPQPPSDIHPSKESVDAAIGDVLSKPWLPLPLGLKPPSVDGVMVELQRQGVPKVPPACA